MFCIKLLSSFHPSVRVFIEYGIASSFQDAFVLSGKSQNLHNSVLYSTFVRITANHLASQNKNNAIDYWMLNAATISFTD